MESILGSAMCYEAEHLDGSSGPALGAGSIYWVIYCVSWSVVLHYIAIAMLVWSVVV